MTSEEINLADGNIREIHRLRGLLAAAEGRAERAETERKAWAEIGARVMARARRWKRAAKHWRMIGKNSERGIKNEIKNNRILMNQIAELQDVRPLAGTELQEYVQDLRERIQVEQMHGIDMEHQRDYWRLQAQDTPRELHAVERARRIEAELEALREHRAYWEPVVKQLGDEHTRQGGELATIRQLAIDLLNQLTVLRMPDESALWRYGGQPLERAYQALKEATRHDL